ncbi:hypothetical protein [Anaerotignum sp.]|uniref:hypothetical protein n=1 Tax=Anaerotignum sp. TaxID=2039241 RepID=UPI0028AE2180|nr:hypothetical protein [Anaerotignum sp.]
MSEIEKAIETLRKISDIETSKRYRELHEIKSFNYDLLTAIEALQEKLEQENPQPLGLEELEKVELLGWVWIEIIEKMELGKSGYYQKNGDWSEGERFCCGYPGLMLGFKYCDYGKTWLAYRYEPKGV